MGKQSHVRNHRILLTSYFQRLKIQSVSYYHIGRDQSLVNYSSQHRFLNLVILNPMHGSHKPSPVIQGVNIMLGLQLCLLWPLKKGLWEVLCIYGYCVLYEQDAVSSCVSLLDRQCISSLSRILLSFPPPSSSYSAIIKYRYTSETLWVWF